jgi:hypothetical protein
MADTPTPTTDEAAKRPVIAKEITAPKTGTDTVSIICKVPNGIVIRAFEKVEEFEQSPTGLRSYHIVKGIAGTEFKCEGPAAIYHQPANMFDLLSRSYPGGFAISHGCPRETWNSWLHWNKDTPLYREGLIFAVGDAADAAIEAKSRASVVSGLEPLDPTDPGKTVGPARGVSAIQPGVPSND